MGFQNSAAAVELVYLLVRRLLELVVLLGRSEASKEIEILVLRHELAVLLPAPGRAAAVSAAADLAADPR